MARYHMNPATGNPNKCSAKEGNCPFKSDDGAEATHYSSPDEARSGYEQEMEAKEEAAHQARLAEAEANWPTPSNDAVAAVEKQGYMTRAGGKSLAKMEIRGDRRVNITVSGGTAFGTLSSIDERDPSLVVDHAQNFNDGQVEVSHEVRFRDSGVKLDIKAAEAHVKKIERLLKEAPAFVEEVNEALGAAKKLYGGPKNVVVKNLYAPAAVPTKPSVAHKGEARDLEVTGERNYYYIRPKQEFDNIQPSIYTDGAGNPHTSISLPSFGSSDPKDVVTRLNELKDSIATAKAMQSKLKEL